MRKIKLILLSLALLSRCSMEPVYAAAPSDCDVLAGVAARLEVLHARLVDKSTIKRSMPFYIIGLGGTSDDVEIYDLLIDQIFDDDEDTTPGIVAHHTRNVCETRSF